MKRRRFLSLLLIVGMMLTLVPGGGILAKAATAHLWYTCLENPDVTFGYVENKADQCSRTITVTRGAKQEINGWVLSSVQIGSYTIEYTFKGNLYMVQEIPSTNLSVFGATAQSDRDFYVGANKACKKKLGSGSKFYTENGRWRATIDTTEMIAGDWIASVKARRVGDSITFPVATIKFTVKPKTGTEGTPSNYAVCNDKPNPDKVKNYSKNAPSRVMIQDEFVTGNTTGFNVSGWAIHDQGIQSYSYTIKDKSTAKVVPGKENLYINALDRDDLADVAKYLQIAVNNNTKHTWYNGTISISGLAQGTYVASIYGKTLDNQTFTVAEITFKVKLGSIAAKEGTSVITKIAAPQTGVNKTLNVQANGDNGNWTAKTTQNWIVLTPDKAKSKLTVQIKPNESAAARTGTFTLACGGSLHTITVTQEPATLSVNPSSITVPVGANSYTFKVAASGSNWSAKSNVSWATVKKSGSDLIVSVSKNPGEHYRKATITVTYAGLQRTISIGQDNYQTCFFNEFSDYINIKQSDNSVDLTKAPFNQNVSDRKAYTVEQKKSILFNRNPQYNRTSMEKESANFEKIKKTVKSLMSEEKTLDSLKVSLDKNKIEIKNARDMLDSGAGRVQSIEELEKEQKQLRLRIEESEALIEGYKNELGDFGKMCLDVERIRCLINLADTWPFSLFVDMPNSLEFFNHYFEGDGSKKVYDATNFFYDLRCKGKTSVKGKKEIDDKEEKTPIGSVVYNKTVNRIMRGVEKYLTENGQSIAFADKDAGNNYIEFTDAFPSTGSKVGAIVACGDVALDALVRSLYIG